MRQWFKQAAGCTAVPGLLRPRRSFGAKTGLPACCVCRAMGSDAENSRRGIGAQAAAFSSTCRCLLAQMVCSWLGGRSTVILALHRQGLAPAAMVQEVGQQCIGPEIDGARFGVGVAVACFGVQFNISNPATGCQKVLEIEDERKL